VALEDDRVLEVVVAVAVVVVCSMTCTAVACFQLLRGNKFVIVHS